MTSEYHASQNPISILAGIGLADRMSLATLLALFEAADSAALAKAAAKGLWDKIAALGGKGGVAGETVLTVGRDRIFRSRATDAELRHQLWSNLVAALNVRGHTPFSHRSARQSASALAVRVSERLSPAIRKAQELAQRKRDEEAKPATGEAERIDWAKWLGQEAVIKIAQAKAMFASKDPLPFSTIIEEEFLSILRDPEVMKAMEASAQDKQMVEGFQKAHELAQTVLVGAGGWAAFAVLIANAGFAPYMLAAQAAGWLPFVGGKVLVSFLAVLVSPLTLFAGIGAMAWLGNAKATDIVGSAIASRICVLLALSSGESTDAGLGLFLDAMRSLTRSPEPAMTHLSSAERRSFRQHADRTLGRLGRPFGSVAGVPPAPWNQRHMSTDTAADLSEVAMAVTFTAAEIYWHAVAIDPLVIEAADFSRIADMGDPLSFAWNARNFASSGAGYSLRGYTAERLVRDHFEAAGQSAVMDHLSNTPGLDLTIDGMPVQVKCGEQLSLLTEHFARYPDIPVIANLELAQKAWAHGADWASKVTTFADFKIARVEAEASEALDHAASILDPGVLELALDLGLLRAGWAVWRGQIPVTDLPVWLMMNAGARGALVFGGGKLGWLAGLVAAGPAGAIIIGPAVACAALIGVRPMQGLATQVILRDWLRELMRLTAILHAELVTALECRITELAKRSASFRVRSPGAGGGFGSWLARRADDDLIATIEEREDLGPPPTKEVEVPILIAKAALLAPTAAQVVAARKAVEVKLLARPYLMNAAWAAASDLINRKTKSVKDAEAGGE